MLIQVCIIGFGSAGKQHERALKQVEDVHVNSILELDKNIDTGEYTRKNKWKDVLEDPNIDAVALCIPPGCRSELALEALRAGKSVMLEKPPCTSEIEIDILMRTAIDLNKTIGVMFQHRYRFPKEIFSMKWDEKTTAVLEISRPRKASQYFKGWRTDPEKSFGGIVAHLGIHYLDLACLILGTPIAIHQTGRREFCKGVELMSAGTISFENGAVMSFIVTGEAQKRSERLRVFSPERTLTIENSELTMSYEGKSIKYNSSDTITMRKKLYDDFKKAIFKKTQPTLCNIESTKRVIKILESLSKKVDLIKG